MSASMIDRVPASDIEHINLATHNGIITVKSVKTGEHRTFKIATQKQDANFAPGERIISLLSGPDNTSDYVGFGFVGGGDDYITIRIWKKKRTPQFTALAKMITNLYRHMLDGTVEVNFEGRCRVCNRPLTTPESVASGIGPICAEKSL